MLVDYSLMLLLRLQYYFPALFRINKVAKAARPDLLEAYLAGWIVAECTLSGSEVFAPGARRPCGPVGRVLWGLEPAGGRTSPLRWRDTSTGPCRCICLRSDRVSDRRLSKREAAWSTEARDSLYS